MSKGEHRFYYLYQSATIICHFHGKVRWPRKQGSSWDSEKLPLCSSRRKMTTNCVEQTLLLTSVNPASIRLLRSCPCFQVGEKWRRIVWNRRSFSRRLTQPIICHFHGKARWPRKQGSIYQIVYYSGQRSPKKLSKESQREQYVNYQSLKYFTDQRPLRCSKHSRKMAYSKHFE
jgi:hypothetical protein